jgi:hypothetical protein
MDLFEHKAALQRFDLQRTSSFHRYLDILTNDMDLLPELIQLF